MSLLKRLDPCLAWPVSALVAATRRLRCLIAHNAAAMPDAPVLIVRPGGMGDLVLANLAWEQVGHPTPVHWLIERRSELWARHLKLNYSCYDIKPFRHLLIQAFSYPIVINTEQRFGLSQAAALFLAGPGGRVISYGTVRANGFSDEQVSYDCLTEHESLAFARLFATAMAAVPPVDLVPSRRYPVSVPPIISIAGQQSPTRTLKPELFGNLAEQWLGQGECLITCAPADMMVARVLARRLGTRARIFQGSFDDLCHAIARSERLFSMDGGPVHIATYYGIPATVIFTSGVARKWAPLASGSQILARSDLPCMPCTRFGQTPPCKIHHACHSLDYARDLKACALPKSTLNAS